MGRGPALLGVVDEFAGTIPRSLLYAVPVGWDACRSRHADRLGSRCSRRRNQPLGQHSSPSEAALVAGRPIRRRRYQGIVAAGPANSRCQHQHGWGAGCHNPAGFGCCEKKAAFRNARSVHSSPASPRPFLLLGIPFRWRSNHGKAPGPFTRGGGLRAVWAASRQDGFPLPSPAGVCHPGVPWMAATRTVHLFRPAAV